MASSSFRPACVFEARTNGICYELGPRPEFVYGKLRTGLPGPIVSPKSQDMRAMEVVYCTGQKVISSVLPVGFRGPGTNECAKS